MPSLASDLILARLHALHPKSIDLSLGRVERLLAALGHPERRLPPIVHIAGTNGKGSTAIMIESLLLALGLRVGRISSPHLSDVTERVSIGHRGQQLLIGAHNRHHNSLRANALPCDTPSATVAAAC